MKKVLLICAILILPFLLFAQDGKILSKELIDIHQDPQINRFLSKNGELLPEYKHLDQVNLYKISYLSDSIEVQGYLQEPKKSGVFPLIIFNRGGNRNYGSLNSLFMSVNTGGLASNGYVVLASQYRGTNGASGRDEFGGEDVNDVINLIKAAKHLEKVDTTWMAMFGWSRGVMMTFLALKMHSNFKTIVVGNGVTDLQAEILERPEMELNVYSQCIPNYWQNKEVELRKRSIIYCVESLPQESSYLILCGSLDKQANPDNSRNLAKKMKKLHFDVKLREFNTDHKFSDKREELNALLLDWFDKELKR